MNEYERNCGSLAESPKNLSGSDFPCVGIVNEMDSDAVRKTTQDVLDTLEERGLFFHCGS